MILALAFLYTLGLGFFGTVLYYNSNLGAYRNPFWMLQAIFWPPVLIYALLEEAWFRYQDNKELKTMLKRMGQHDSR